MTKEEIIEMAEKVYGKCDWHDSALVHLEQFAKLVAKHEREACAEVCISQMQGKSIWVEGARACSLAIQARGQE